MIALISGMVTSILDAKLIVMQSGIGFEMLCPSARQFQLKSTITLYTYVHWSQENGPSLFGFATVIEKELFLLLIECQGIGPKLAISMLEQSQVSNLLQMIMAENVEGLSKLKGLGLKKAELICMTLKNKASKLLTNYPELGAVTSFGVWNDLHETLVSLNYSVFEIKQATALVKENLLAEKGTFQEVPFDLLLRKALQVLAKK